MMPQVLLWLVCFSFVVSVNSQVAVSSISTNTSISRNTSGCKTWCRTNERFLVDGLPQKIIYLSPNVSCLEKDTVVNTTCIPPVAFVKKDKDPGCWLCLILIGPVLVLIFCSSCIKSIIINFWGKIKNICTPKKKVKIVEPVVNDNNNLWELSDNDYNDYNNYIADCINNNIDNGIDNTNA